MSASVEYVEFTQKQADAWDKMQKLKEKASAAYKADKEAKSIRDELVTAFGDSAVAVLPDGRKLTKAKKSMHRNATKAFDVEWWEINEAG